MQVCLVCRQRPPKCAETCPLFGLETLFAEGNREECRHKLREAVQYMHSQSHHITEIKQMIRWTVYSRGMLDEFRSIGFGLMIDDFPMDLSNPATIRSWILMQRYEAPFRVSEPREQPFVSKKPFPYSVDMTDPALRDLVARGRQLSNQKRAVLNSKIPQAQAERYERLLVHKEKIEAEWEGFVKEVGAQSEVDGELAMSLILWSKEDSVKTKAPSWLEGERFEGASSLVISRHLAPNELILHNCTLGLFAGEIDMIIIERPLNPEDAVKVKCVIECKSNCHEVPYGYNRVQLHLRWLTGCREEYNVEDYRNKVHTKGHFLKFIHKEYGQSFLFDSQSFSLLLQSREPDGVFHHGVRFLTKAGHVSSVPDEPTEWLKSTIVRDADNRFEDTPEYWCQIAEQLRARWGSQFQELHQTLAAFRRYPDMIVVLRDAFFYKELGIRLESASDNEKVVHEYDHYLQYAHPQTNIAIGVPCRRLSATLEEFVTREKVMGLLQSDGIRAVIEEYDLARRILWSSSRRVAVKPTVNYTTETLSVTAPAPYSISASSPPSPDTAPTNTSSVDQHAPSTSTAKAEGEQEEQARGVDYVNAERNETGVFDIVPQLLLHLSILIGVLSALERNSTTGELQPDAFEHLLLLCQKYVDELVREGRVKLVGYLPEGVTDVQVVNDAVKHILTIL